jgi:lipopolysaccharide/colanic/teichoic acid biosynthesis glycosyltransferase
MLIKLDSRGHVFLKQERMGMDGKIFTLFKFRSMREDAESKSGPVWAAKDDDRVTRVGGIIRKTRLDELPQLINVLKGEMSFVGPRPERPFFIEQLKEKIPYYGLRESVRPGVTGWAQIRYPYGASVDDAFEKLQYDLYYIKNMSFLLDLIIIFETARVVLLGRGSR